MFYRFKKNLARLFFNLKLFSKIVDKKLFIVLKNYNNG